LSHIHQRKKNYSGKNLRPKILKKPGISKKSENQKSEKSELNKKRNATRVHMK
jgi:hypothetical protein